MMADEKHLHKLISALLVGRGCNQNVLASFNPRANSNIAKGQYDLSMEMLTNFAPSQTRESALMTRL